MRPSRHVFVTGGTGYIGRRVIPALLSRGHRVRALARDGSQAKLPAGCVPVVGNALDHETFASRVAPRQRFSVETRKPDRRRVRSDTSRPG